ncbi:MAG: pantoate--beta-alanine ligase [Burkholderiales bacterium]|nr:pantoate--beta-alanine ligase [Nitrosomonas sp.]MCP5276516.1 pantoate--beta-alanine ligase [Burkholderiales bacterium]
MKIIENIEALRSTLKNEENIAFVPTMGNLHEGHLSLIRIAKKHADFVVVSIFVNPLQFLPSEDFNQYPRSFNSDCNMLRNLDVDLVFAPNDKILFPVPQEILVLLPPVANKYEGEFRQGFFCGVATIVLKLFNIIQPDIAIFGKKDYQQLHIIRLMVQQFNFAIKILDGEIVRATDGLALSSRNQYLNNAQRLEACNLYQALQSIVNEVKNGHSNFSFLEKKATDKLSERDWKVDYISILDKRTLLPAQANDRELVILAAAQIGKTRLIDNIEFINEHY